MNNSANDQKILQSCIEKLTKMVETRGEPFKVLIVDDEEWVREVFKDFCGVTKAIEVELAESGEEALRLAAQNRYDIITLDLIMPEMSGLDVLADIKKVSPRVPVWVITGNSTERLVKEAGILGASRVMYKPVVLHDFIAELVEAFSAKM
ncbi:MAG: response regulator [candidate division Zixibacteria bacterium]|nr:response regulator [candidate division Zixibacteria bacterium]